jgi:hypothetical protein
MKLWSAKQSISTASETIESFGGAGYIEDTGIPRLLRDAQVYSIWEGTTNVLSLDVLRAIAKENALFSFFSDVDSRLKKIASGTFSGEVTAVRDALRRLQAHAEGALKAGPDVQSAGARAFAFGLGRIYAASLLLEFAEWSAAHGERPQAIEVARRFCRRPLFSPIEIAELGSSEVKKVVFG